MNFVTRPTASLNLDTIHLEMISRGAGVVAAAGCKDAGEPIPQLSATQHNVILERGKAKAQSEIEMSEVVMLKHVWKMKNEESPGPDNTCFRVLQGLRNKMIAYFH